MRRLTTETSSRSAVGSLQTRVEEPSEVLDISAFKYFSGNATHQDRMKLTLRHGEAPLYVMQDIIVVVHLKIILNKILQVKYIIFITIYYHMYIYKPVYFFFY